MVGSPRLASLQDITTQPPSRHWTLIFKPNGDCERVLAGKSAAAELGHPYSGNHLEHRESILSLRLLGPQLPTGGKPSCLGWRPLAWTYPPRWGRFAATLASRIGTWRPANLRWSRPDRQPRGARVFSFRPSGETIGSSKRRDQDTTQLPQIKKRPR